MEKKERRLGIHGLEEWRPGIEEWKPGEWHAVDEEAQAVRNVFKTEIAISPPGETHNGGRPEKEGEKRR